MNRLHPRNTTLLKLGAFLLLLLAAGAAVMLIQPSGDGPSNDWSRTLAAKVRENPVNGIEFAEIAPVAWDRVHVFDPYSNNDEIDAQLGFVWDGKKRSRIMENDGISLVVFVHDDKVVGWFEHGRNEGDLCPLAIPQGFSRPDARFQVRKDETGWIEVYK